MTYKIQSDVAFGFVLLLFSIHVSNGLNLGLISGDLKRTSSPLIIRKTSHHSPVTINIKSGLPKLPAIIPPVFTSKLSKKPLPVKARKKPISTKPLRLRKLSKLPMWPKTSKLPKLPKWPKTSKLPKLPKLPKIRKLTKIPKLPFLPLLPPKLPLLPVLPILPALPLLPPILPRLSRVLKPIRIPIISKSGLKALGSEMRPIVAPAPNLKRHILEKLLKLRKDGSLTTPEFLRFKKILL